METKRKRNDSDDEDIALPPSLLGRLKNGKSLQERRDELAAFREQLPIHAHKTEIQAMIKEHQVVVLSAETGSGKTTQVPQYLNDLSPQGKVACTQPRRVAAISVADRVAEEMGVPLGAEVGYNVRFERRVCPATKVLYLTDGMLLREISQDHNLSEYSVVCVDEAHERTVDTDILLALLKVVLSNRPEFRVVVMSATLDAERFQKFFGNAPSLAIPGRVFEVSEYFITQPATNLVQSCVQHVTNIHNNMGEGDILCFLAGEGQIKQCIRATQEALKRSTQKAVVFPLYGALPLEEQRKVFEQQPEGTRKIIFSTNIAETSVTIDGVVYVVDSGMHKQHVYDANTHVDCLLLSQISKASATQRKGRAGRSRPGACYRLYQKALYEQMDPQTYPEMTRSNLDDVLLYMVSLGITNILSFDYLDAPPQQSIVSALERLVFMDALSASEAGVAITELGEKMAMLPLSCCTARMVLKAAKHGCGSDMVRLAGALESPRLFFRPEGKKEEADAARAKFICPTSDHVTLLNVFDAFVMSKDGFAFCKEHFLNFQSLRNANRIWEQLWSICNKVGVDLNSCADPTTRKFDAEKIGQAVAEGFFLHAVCRTKNRSQFTAVRNDVIASVHQESTVSTVSTGWLVFHTMEMHGRGNGREEVQMMTVSEVQLDWLLDASPEYFDPEDLEKVDIGEVIRLHLDNKRQAHFGI